MKKLLIASVATVLLGLSLYFTNYERAGDSINSPSKNNTKKMPTNYSLLKESSSRGTKRAGLSDASKYLAFKPEPPTNSLGKKIVAVYTSEIDFPVNERRFYALFEEELLFAQGPIIKAPGALRVPGLKEVHDEDFYIDVKVNGIEAIAHDPIDIKTENFRAKGGSGVIWQTDNFKYGVSHPTMSYKELIKVAESVPVN